MAKKGVRKCEHAIIFTGKNAPSPHAKERPTREERGLLPQPIRIDSDDPDQKLDATSRIDFGKVYTIEHNVKVCSMGKVNRLSEGPLLLQLKVVWASTIGLAPNREQTEKGATTTATESQSPHMVLEWIDAYNTLIANNWTDERARSVLRHSSPPGAEQHGINLSEDNNKSPGRSNRVKKRVPRVTLGEDQADNGDQDTVKDVT